MSEPEIWKVCTEFPDYAVSSLGRVRRHTDSQRTKSGYVLKPSRISSGYDVVTLSRDSIQTKILVHRLVAREFLGPQPSPAHEVAHYDGGRTNNALSNLRWATRAENTADKKRHGTFHIGSRHGNSKLKEGDIPEIRRRLEARESCRSIGEAFGVARATIYSVKIGSNWSWVGRES